MLFFNSCQTRVNYYFQNDDLYNWKYSKPKHFALEKADYYYTNIISNELIKDKELNLTPYDTNYLNNSIEVYFKDYGYINDFKSDEDKEFDYKYYYVNKFDTSLTTYNDFYILRYIYTLHRSYNLDTNNLNNKLLTKVFINGNNQHINSNSKKTYNTSKSAEYKRSNFELISFIENQSLVFFDTIFCNLKEVENMRIEFENLIIDEKHYKPEPLILKKVITESKGIEFLRNPRPPNRTKIN